MIFPGYIGSKWTQHGSLHFVGHRIYPGKMKSNLQGFILERRVIFIIRFGFNTCQIYYQIMLFCNRKSTFFTFIICNLFQIAEKQQVGSSIILDRKSTLPVYPV